MAVARDGFAFARDENSARDWLAPVFDRFGVDLVFSGDDHNYQRSHPVRMAADRECDDREPLPCIDGDPSACYQITDAAGGRHYADPDGTIYVVTGGGGQILYPALVDVDRAFSNVFVLAFHAVELEVWPSKLVVRAVDTEGDLIDRFTVSKRRLLRGDMNFDETVNIADAVAILNALFGNRPATCLPAGNANGDDRVNIADPVWLLNFLFAGGPSPTEPYPDCGLLREPAVGVCGRLGC